MNFGQALEELKNGGAVARKGWNGKGQYIELAEKISYTNSKNEVINPNHENIGNKAIAFVGTSGVQLGWLASQADMLADDWVADPLEEKEDADLTKLRESVARYYGFPAQLQKLGEECTELACETIHHKKKTQLHPNTANADLKSEMADVLNMVEQICYLSNCREEVEKIALGKMQRQMKRIQTAQGIMRGGLNG